MIKGTWIRFSHAKNCTHTHTHQKVIEINFHIWTESVYILKFISEHFEPSGISRFTKTIHFIIEICTWNLITAVTDIAKVPSSLLLFFGIQTIIKCFLLYLCKYYSWNGVKVDIGTLITHYDLLTTTFYMPLSFRTRTNPVCCCCCQILYELTGL